MNFRYVFAFLRLLKIPGMLPVMKDWQAFLRLHFLYAAHESGLLSVLASPCGKDALIERLGVKRPDLLDALLDMGMAVKELTLKDGLYVIRGKRSKAILGEKGDILAAMIQANVTYYSDAYRHAAHRLLGGELGDDLDEIGDLVARFSKGIEPIIRKFVSSVVSGKSSMRVLDVGCGSGVHLKGVYNANRNATGIGLDIDPVVADQATDNIAEWGLSDRFKIFHGDIRKPPEEIVGPFDLITLYNNLYYFNEQDQKDVLNTLRTMLSPEGMLAVVMNFHSGGRDIGAANLNMVTCSLKGLTPLPDVDAISSLLKRTGFGSVDIHRFIPGSTFLGVVAKNP